ncbi:hypothetical protein BH11PLA2_BH11PLA2_51780 [soil metagenome]
MTVNAGSIIQGGDSAFLTAHALTLNGGLTTVSGAIVDIRLITSTPVLNSLNPSSNTFLNITGGTTSLDSSTKFAIDGTGLGLVGSYTYRIAAGAGTQSLNLNNQSLFTSIGFTGSNYLLTANNGGEVFVSFTAVPEPSLMFCMAGLWTLALSGLPNQRSPIGLVRRL